MNRKRRGGIQKGGSKTHLFLLFFFGGRWRKPQLGRRSGGGGASWKSHKRVEIKKRGKTEGNKKEESFLPFSSTKYEFPQLNSVSLNRKNDYQGHWPILPLPPSQFQAMRVRCAQRAKKAKSAAQKMRHEEPLMLYYFLGQPSSPIWQASRGRNSGKNA